MKNVNLVFKIAAVLWVLWGLVHVLAGVLTVNFILSGDISSAISGIADGLEPASVQMEYPAAAGAIIGQHGFNLLWIGLVTFISAFFVWKGNKQAIFLAAIVGGLADLGYFIFLDLGVYVKFMPGSLMTIISASAIILSFYGYFKNKKAAKLS